MDKKLRILLELVVDKFGNNVRGATRIFRGFVDGIRNGVGNAGRALVSLSKSVFFVTNAFQQLWRIAQGLWNMFVGGAQSVEKLKARFITLTGSVEAAEAMMDMARAQSLRTGKSLDEVAEGLGMMTTSARDASGAFDMEKLKVLNGQLEVLATARPDVPIQFLARALNQGIQSGDWSSLEQVTDASWKTTEAFKELGDTVDEETETISRGVTSIETGAKGMASTAEQRIDAVTKAMEEIYPGAKAGMEALTDVSGLERMGAAAQDMANAFGGPVFEAINQVASTFADLYEQDPEFFRDLAQSLGEGVAKIIESLAQVDPQKLKETLAAMAEGLQETDWGSIAEQIKGVADSFVAIADSIERILGMMGQAGETLGQLNQIAGMEGVELGGKGPMGGPATGGKTSIAERLLGGGNGQQRVQVDISLNTDLFQAVVRQQADRAVTDGFGAVTEELGGPK